MDLKKTGRLIIKKRKAQNLTQEQLSEKLYVTSQAVSLWEKGLRFPDPAAQVMIYKVLGLNPVELLTGLEMFDEELKKKIAGYMERIDEKVPTAGTYVDEDGFEEYINLTEGLVILKGKDEDFSGNWVPYSDYYNVEKVESPAEDRPPKTEYDPRKLYMNQGHCIVTIPVEMLQAIGSPEYVKIRWNEENMRLAIVADDEGEADFFDIPAKLYTGKWKGLHIYGGEFGVMVLKKMGIRKRRELLEVIPIVDVRQRAVIVHLDEVKRSGAELEYNDFLLPQWQYEELIQEDEDDFE